MSEPFVTGEPLVAVAEVIDRLERGWFAAEADDGSDLYHYVAGSLTEFLSALTLAGDHTPGRRYLDVGCGIGTKLALAGLLGWQAEGIEIREQYAAVARHLSRAKIEVADARRYVGYDAFDVVYAYRPLISEEGQAAFEDWLTLRMRPGSLLISLDRVMPRPWEAIGPSVWRR